MTGKFAIALAISSSLAFLGAKHSLVRGAGGWISGAYEWQPQR